MGEGMTLEPGMLFAKRDDRPWACAKLVLVISDDEVVGGRLLRYTCFAPRQYGSQTVIGLHADYIDGMMADASWYHSSDMPAWLDEDFILVGR